MEVNDPAHVHYYSTIYSICLVTCSKEKNTNFNTLILFATPPLHVKKEIYIRLSAGRETTDETTKPDCDDESYNSETMLDFSPLGCL